MSEYLQNTLDSEIKKRINHQSPTKYDMDFYIRKISRIESDNSSLTQQVNRLRLRLRRAQDYELKYQLLLKQLCSLQSDIDTKDKQINELKAKLQDVMNNVKQKDKETNNWEGKMVEMQEEINRWRDRADQAEQTKLAIVMEIKDKQALQVKRQIQINKRDFNDKQDQYQYQIRSLKKIVDQKQSVQTVVKNKVEKIRSEKDDEIQRLRKNMETLKNQCKQTIRQKNQQIQQMRQKFERLFNFELQNIRKSQQDTDQLFNIEVNGLRELIGIKNDQIQRLLNEIKSLHQQQQISHDAQLQQVSILKQSIYKIQRQNQLQLYSLKQRLSKIHSKDLQTMQNRFKNIVQSLKLQRKQLETYIKEKDRILEQEHKQLERVKADYIDRLKERQVRIQTLMDRIKTAGDVNQRETQNLHQSLHIIQSEKQIMTSQFEVNVGFLTNQMAKQSATNQSKNQQIKKLHEQIARVKKQYNTVILDIQNRWKQQRRQWQQLREQDRTKYESLQQRLRSNQRQFKSKQKQLIRELDKHILQNKKLQFIIKQMQTDTQRLNKYIKQLDQQVKKGFKQNQTGKLDNAGIRRELGANMDRQKNELDAIMRMELDQIKSKMDNQLTHLKNENQRLQTDLLKKTINCQNLEQNLKKIESLNKNIQILNKDKLVEYEKKMATLNQEIALTQNLYQAFMQAKARSAK